MDSDSEYEYASCAEHDEINFFCTICGCTIPNCDPDSFIDDLFCDVCEQHLNDYIDHLPPPPLPLPLPKLKIKTID